MPAFAGLESQRYRGIERFLLAGSTAAQTLDVSGFAAERDLALGVIAQQFTPEQGLVRVPTFRAADRSRGRISSGIRSGSTRSNPRSGACATAAAFVARPGG